jgi:hypothetical protein
MRSRRPVSLLLPALALAAPLAAQRPSPDDYLAYLPPTPRIVARTAATSQLRLYGDPETPGYLDVDPRELTGGVTYRLPPTESEALRVYLRGGYMLTLLPSRHWWPNTAYTGLGLELASPTHRWLLQRVAYGLRLEGTGSLHRLRPAGDCDDCRVMAKRGDLALFLFLAW